MTSNFEWSSKPAGGRREKKKVSSRTFTNERIEEVDTPGGKKVRKVTTRRTVSKKIVLIEKWSDNEPAAGGATLPCRPAGDGSQWSGQESRPMSRSQPRLSGDSGLDASQPQRWKLSLSGVRRADGRSAPEIDGDYILDQVYSDAHQSRGEHLFSAQNGLFRASLDVVVTKDRAWQLTAELSGVTPGPRWTAKVTSLCKHIVLRRRGNEIGEIVAQFNWPKAVQLTPLGMSVPRSEGSVLGSWEGTQELAKSMLGSVEP